MNDPTLPPSEGGRAPSPPAHHRWVYLALAVFLLALGFGGWGVWAAFFAGSYASTENAAALRARGHVLFPREPIGNVALIALDPVDGAWLGAADPRVEATAAGY